MTSSIDVRPRLVNGGVNDKASRIHLAMSRFNGMAFFIYQHKIIGSDLGEVHCIRVFDEMSDESEWEQALIAALTDPKAVRF